MIRELKLFTRYNRIILPVILGIFILSGLGCFVLVQHLLIADFDDSLNEQAQKIALYTHKYGEFPKVGLTDDWLISYRQNDHIEPRHIETTQRYDSEDGDSSSYRTLTFTFNLNGRYYQVIISKSLEALEGLSRSIAIVTIMTLLAVILVTLLLSRLVLKRLWQPFYFAMDRLRDYQLNRMKGVPAMDTGTTEFNFMNERISELIREVEREYKLLKEFTENASHEMQTPISIIRSKLDMIVQGENLSEQQSEAMQSAYLAARRLSTLGQSLLLLSKIENRQFSDSQLISLDEKLKDKMIELQEFWEDKLLTVNLHCEPAKMMINHELLDILINNLFSNAGKHNITEGTIDVFIKQGLLTFSNTGYPEPINPDRIFVRFYKQQQHSMNNGLGLAIIKQICDQSAIRISYTFEDKRHVFSLSWDL